MNPGKLHPLAEAITIFELVLGLAGEANDNIGGYSRTRNVPAYLQDSLFVLRSVVPTPHAV